ncbi:MAG TPA: hypothetical protein PLZ32_14655, partial [Saprospiraceae bacterium]|nr:hypothetical protein [Saprospiraceae bacterium]
MIKKSYTRNKVNIAIALSTVILLGFRLKSTSFDIPKTWDMTEIMKFMLPTVDSTVTVRPISEEYYYKLPERKIFKSYPIRLTDDMEANRKYIDSLKLLDPIDIFQNEPKTEQDLIRLGEEVFNAPLTTFDYSEDFLSGLKESIKNAEVPIANKTFPFYSYVIDEKSKIKVGVFACAMCHTRVMPDGATIKGAQGNFPLDRIDGFEAEIALKSLPKEKLKEFDEGMRAGRNALHKAPWSSHSS